MQMEQIRPSCGGPAWHRVAGAVRSLPAAALLVVAALPVARPADADGLDDDGRAFAVASIARQGALALRLAAGQTDNLKSHLEGLRNDACGPVAVAVSLGETDATAAWESLLDADDATRSKTLATPASTKRCANAARAWTGGSLTLANGAPDTSGRDFQRLESNLSAGLDARLGADLAVGLALGGSNGDTIESDGRTRGSAGLGAMAAYASYHPTASTFAEGAVGAARLEMSDRVVGAGDALSGHVEHPGLAGFLTASIGRLDRWGDLKLSPYLKATGQIARLGETSQTIGTASYREGPQYAARLSGTVGLDAAMPVRRLPDWIAVEPTAGVEIGYALDDLAPTAITASQDAGAEEIGGSLSTSRMLRLDVGTNVTLFQELSLSLDLETQPIAEGRPKTLRISSSWDF
ncbi:autotransporter outer membrane beta-barrel domain-containing protein [Jiella sonneratiae]|uniref:Autotransporter outer membrane beta-barrel domain-containing protein n=1 Tax=Jiella sonneratiae TaxID=2816856 RepID=A0ABS3J9P4_9HYPH|nr:autotransporter outer membrane beta-barrel domain-containing protein [Jiella sonneratiae]MBO0906392.1 autotransporter outer membrane beta-barrel domain-containing protein [Jiella sonneratiae]